MSAAVAPAAAAPGASAPAGGGEDWGLRGLEQPAAELRSALASGRLGHAWLFAGPEGVGKAALARRLAQALQCERPAAERAGGADPCRECRDCRRVEAGEAPDIERVAIGGPCEEEGHRDHAADGSTRIRICQARRLARLANLAPFRAPRRMFVVDTADALQTEACHALLKTLEEPPGGALLILLAADPDALLPTIRSRCRELTLRPLSRPALAEALAADLGLGAAEAGELAALGRGRYGLALRLHGDPALRQLRETALADARHLAAASRNERLDWAAQAAATWRRERQPVLGALDVWAGWWRDALAAAAGAETAAGDAPPPACTPREAAAALAAVWRARGRLLENVNPQLALEVLMLDLPVLPPGRTGQQETSREEDRTLAAPPA